MRNFSRIKIFVSQDDGNSKISVPLVEINNGVSSIQAGDLESAFGMLPKGSHVCVIANGTVGNISIHGFAHVIREGGMFVSLDLSAAEEISRVSDSPFRENLGLVSMLFPRNLLSISQEAFAGCANLERVIIPSSVQKIGERAFSGCERLSSLKFDEPNGWFAEIAGKEPLEILNLEDEADNPCRFTLKSSPYRDCLLKKIS